MVNKSFGKIVLVFNGKRSTTLGCKDIGKSEFETKTQKSRISLENSLWPIINSSRQTFQTT